MKKETKVDYVSVTEAFNKLIQSDKKIHTPSEMRNICKGIGIRADVFQLMMKKGTFFRTRKIGTKKEVVFSSTPIYKNIFKELFEEAANVKKNKPKVFKEEEVIEFLKSKGYRIYREDGINENALKKEHPELYRRYLIVNEV